MSHDTDVVSDPRPMKSIRGYVKQDLDNVGVVTPVRMQWSVSTERANGF